MKKKLRILFFLLLVMVSAMAQNPDPHGTEESAITGMASLEIKTKNPLYKMDRQNGKMTSEKPWSQDEAEVRATLEKFLLAAGNYNLEVMKKMMAANANLAITRLKNNQWSAETVTMDTYFNSAKDQNYLPYFEPLSKLTIHISDGQLAFVKADGILHRFGMPLKHNVDYFTLLKENGTWKFTNISFTSTPIPENKRSFDTTAFAKGYAQAWCSQKPEYVAMFYTENGSLKINDGTPAVGRTAITQSAKAFMDTFPDDMIVAFNKLVKTPKGIEFHWTLTGTNTGPGGTGKKVNISGFELWQLNEKGLIKESKGSFDAEEYQRQLKYGLAD